MNEVDTFAGLPFCVMVMTAFTPSLRARLQHFALVNAILAGVHGKALLKRCATVGAVSGTAIGATAGLILGLNANPATAWFAVFEVAIPGCIAGGVMGCLATLIVKLGRPIKRGSTPSP